MLTQPDGNRRAVGETHHRVFPVADVVAEDLSVDRKTLVEGVEVHVEGVEEAVAVVREDDGAGCGVGCCVGCGVGSHAIEPGGVGGDVVFGGEVEGAGGGVGGRAVAEGVELVEGREGEGRGRVGDGGEVEGGEGVVEVGADVGGEVGFVFVEVEERGWIC